MARVTTYVTLGNRFEVVGNGTGTDYDKLQAQKRFNTGRDTDCGWDNRGIDIGGNRYSQPD